MNKEEATAQALVIKEETHAEIIKIIEQSAIKMRDIGFADLSGTCELTISGRFVGDEVNPNKAVPDGSLADTFNEDDMLHMHKPENEMFKECLVAVYRPNHKTVDDAMAVGEFEVVGDEPGREPGLGSGTLSDLGAILLGLSANRRMWRSAVCPDHQDELAKYLPKVAIMLTRRNGDEWRFDGTLDNAMHAVNETLRLKDLNAGFKLFTRDDWDKSVKVKTDLEGEDSETSVPVEGVDQDLASKLEEHFGGNVFEIDSDNLEERLAALAALGVPKEITDTIRRVVGGEGGE